MCRRNNPGEQLGNNNKNKQKITSFTSFSLRLSGMRITYGYEAVSNGETTTLVRYVMKYGKTPQKENEAVNEIPTAEVVDLFNELGINEWNGFVGKHPKNVCDGEMFDFSATVDGDRTIRANGSENFPKNYREFKRRLGELLPN